MGPSGEQGPQGRRRRRWLAAGALAVVVALALAVVLLASGSGGHRGSDTGVPVGQTTTTVTRRTLSESSTVDGTLGYGATLELYDRLSGTFTSLPSVGSVVGRGGTLFRVDNLPVALMYGSVPAYRTLKQGVGDGPDVTELNDNLIDLGYDPYGAISDVVEFGEATAAAVRRWQKAEGLSETGEIELGRIIFAPGARRVTDVHVALGQDPPGVTGATGAEEPAAKTPAAKKPAAKKPTNKKPTAQKPAAEQPADKNPTNKKPASKKPAGKKPAGKKPADKAPADKEPADKEPAGKEAADKGEDEPGGSAGAGMVVLTTTSSRQIVTLKVKAEQQELAHLGETAPVTLPGGDVVRGRITEVGTVASTGSGGEKSPSGEKGEGEESATIPVTLVLDRPVAHLDEAPVSVELVKNVRRDVLTVPATALTATAGGGYAIEALEGVHRVELRVAPGLFADGYVQVEGAGVHEGLTVLESE